MNTDERTAHRVDADAPAESTVEPQPTTGLETDESVVDERPRCRELGANLVEYALLLALIAIVCIGAVTALGGETEDGDRGIQRSADSIVNAGTP